jgi:carboxymethylenebutenolidase
MYLAKPQNLNGKGVILIHEFWGLNQQIKGVADRLAKEGFTALAVDLYKSKITSNPEEARKLKDAVKDDEALLILREAIRTLGKEGIVNDKIAFWGFCMGGSFSFLAAVNQIPAGAYIIYYGGRISDDESLLKKIQAPILGVFGGLDKGIPKDLVWRFRGNLTKLGKTNEVYIYDDADHAFFNEERPVYNEKAARDAWQKTLVFLNRYL